MSQEKIIITLGETMLRLSPAVVGERISFSNYFRVEPGGSESNVAVTLAQLGHRTCHITRVPDSPLGHRIIRYLRGMGVGVDRVSLCHGRIGLYWTESGVGPRPSQVVYDRQDSVFSTWSPDEVEWERVFDSAAWFHSSGITPAVSESAADLLTRALESTPKTSLTSIDLNYRKKLWQYLPGNDVKDVHNIMDRLCQKCDYIFGNETDFNDCLGIKLSSRGSSVDKWSKIARTLFHSYPRVKGMAVSLRDSYNASENGWTGFLILRSGSTIEAFQGPYFEIKDIVDRIGTGDSFAAGVIHGLVCFSQRPQDVIDFAVTLSALKHTLRGDVCMVTEDEVWNVLKAKGSGRIER